MRHTWRDTRLGEALSWLYLGFSIETLALGGTRLGEDFLYMIFWSVDGDVLVISWTEFFYKKSCWVSPKVGFPKINSCALVSTVHG